MIECGNMLSVIAVVYVYMNKEGKTYRDKMLFMPDSVVIQPEDEITISANSIEWRTLGYIFCSRTRSREKQVLLLSYLLPNYPYA